MVMPLNIPMPHQPITIGDALLNGFRQAQAARNAYYQNQIAKAAAGVAPQMVQAKLGLSQAQIPLVQANTAHTQEGTKLMPLQAAIEAQNSQNVLDRLGQSRSRFGQAYQMSRMLRAMSPAARSAWMANHQQQYDQMTADIANGVNSGAISSQSLQQSSPNTLITAQLLQQSGIPPATMASPVTQQQQRAGGVKAPNPMQGVPQSMAAPQGAQLGNAIKSALGNGMQQQPSQPFMETAPQTAQIRRASKMAANKDLTTTTIQNQAQSGAALEKFINGPNATKMLSALSSYPGIGGSLEKEYDKLKGNPKYLQYEEAQKQFAPFIAGGISQLEGLAKTDHGLNSALDTLKKNQLNFLNSPEQGVQYFNNLKQLLASRNAALQSAAHPMFNVQRIQGAQQPGSSVVQIPSFQNKQQFQQWYGGLSPSQQAQVKSHLGGGQ